MPEENNTPKKRESGNKGKHTNRALSHYRVTQIYNELKLLKSNTDIRTKFSEEWGVSPRTVDTYIKKANKHIRQDNDIDRHDMLLKLLHCYEHLFTESLKTKQHSNALGALNGISRITRIDPAADKK